MDPTNAVAPMPPTQPVQASSTQIRNENTLTKGTPVDMQKLRSLGVRLTEQFKTYENHRRLAEMRWTRNLRQFLGEYDPDVTKQLDPTRSKAYPRHTRVKVVSMVSRLMNLLFPTTEKNWGIEPSPVPNLSMQDLQTVLQAAMQGAQQAQNQITDAVIEGAIRAFAGTRAGNLEREIDDQLAEVGGSRGLPYAALARKVLYSGVLYGVGVLKGPFVRQQKQRTWQITNGQPVPQEEMALRPHFDFVTVWDYYPDMTAKHLNNMDGQFHRLVLTAQQLRELGELPDYFKDVIVKFIADNPKGNWRERSYESELRTIGVQTNVNVLAGQKYEVIVWDGYITTQNLREAGIDLPSSYQKDMVEGSVWMIGNECIRAEMSPWVALEPELRVQQYHHFVFEEDDSNLLGNGLPNIMRDSQMGISAATRMAMDNASIVCGPMIEANLDRLRPGQDKGSIVPYKIWYTEGEGAAADKPALHVLDVPSHLEDLIKLVQLHEHFADMETFVNPATGGDMEKMPSEPMRTAAGASMLRGDVALPFKDVVRNFDNFTISVITSLVLFNKHFNPKPEIEGDFMPIARGSSSLIAKEVRGMALDAAVQTMQPEEREYIDWYKFLQARLKVRDMDVTDVVVDEDAAKKIDADRAQQQQQDKQDMRELLRAEVRKLLADATKSLTQSDANSAKSETAIYNAILGGLESGVAPTDVHAARAGAGIPDAVAAGFRRKSGADPTPTASAKH